ncbi:hypothetical protein KY284_020062 [Solanum tuberosum]|nr:hypothetical protein KY284_020062 [Solanum tuberosum]
MFQTTSAVKEGEYSDLIMFDNSHLALHCFLSAGSHAHLIGRSIFDYYMEFDYTKLLLWLYQFPPDQFGFSFPFDPGSSLLSIFLGAASYDSHMVAADFKEFIRIFTCRIDSTSNAQCILPQFPFDPDANIFIITPGGCLQVSILQREVFNWDPTLCSKSMARIKLTTRTSVFSWRETLHVLLFVVPYEHKSSESEFALALTIERDVSNT